MSKISLDELLSKHPDLAAQLAQKVADGEKIAIMPEPEARRPRKKGRPPKPRSPAQQAAWEKALATKKRNQELRAQQREEAERQRLAQMQLDNEEHINARIETEIARLLGSVTEEAEVEVEPPKSTRRRGRRKATPPPEEDEDSDDSDEIVVTRRRRKPRKQRVILEDPPTPPISEPIPIPKPNIMPLEEPEHTGYTFNVNDFLEEVDRMRRTF